MDNIVCGLDFGTSNSVISIVDKATGKELFSYSDKSIIYFPETNDFTYFVGKEAEKRYVEEGMQGRLLKSVKTLLKQDKFLFTWICGKRVTPEDLVMCIIKFMKEKAETFLGHSIETIALGRPALFSKYPKQEQTAVKRLLMAAQKAGFKTINLQLEPIAAAYSYESKIDKAETVFVADFGGGTSDFTIMQLSPDKYLTSNREDDILLSGGVYVGGDAFDSDLMWHKITPHLGRGVEYQSYNKWLPIPNAVFHELKQWERSFLLKESKLRKTLDGFYVHSNSNPLIHNLRLLIDNNYTYALFKAIEQAKMDLSQKEEVDFIFQNGELKLRDQISLDDFSKLIQDNISSISRCVDEMFDSSELSVSDIDSVFITGGSSFVLPVQRLIESKFGKDKVRIGDAFNSVAYGLALSLS